MFLSQIDNYLQQTIPLLCNDFSYSFNISNYTRNINNLTLTSTLPIVAQDSALANNENVIITNLYYEITKESFEIIDYPTTEINTKDIIIKITLDRINSTISKATEFAIVEANIDFYNSKIEFVNNIANLYPSIYTPTLIKTEANKTVIYLLKQRLNNNTPAPSGLTTFKLLTNYNNPIAGFNGKKIVSAVSGNSFTISLSTSFNFDTNYSLYTNIARIHYRPRIYSGDFNRYAQAKLQTTDKVLLPSLIFNIPSSRFSSSTTNAKSGTNSNEPYGRISEIRQVYNINLYAILPQAIKINNESFLSSLLIDRFYLIDFVLKKCLLGFHFDNIPLQLHRSSGVEFSDNGYEDMGAYFICTWNCSFNIEFNSQDMTIFQRNIKPLIGLNLSIDANKNGDAYENILNSYSIK